MCPWVKRKSLNCTRSTAPWRKIQVPRKTETEEVKRCIFRDSLEDMFDLARFQGNGSEDPRGMTSVLGAQREDRQSASMAGVDEKLNERLRRSDVRAKDDEMKKKDAAASSSTFDRDVALDLECSTTFLIVQRRNRRTKNDFKSS
ncbi:hypothetical protein GWK47_041259 [Chionoecetes opilio]|uniref:Uncharacterized protein n=1 Tax=Chionoecetes opilio TaxID=41210 RepID=A0A8J4YI32_CHIOP|nr:hypothetical protein GWK47_041259 [Chionoecetes opilio]